MDAKSVDISKIQLALFTSVPHSAATYTCVGPQGHVYVAAMNRIMRHTLESHRPHVIRSKDINGAIDIAVDLRKDIVRYTSYTCTLEKHHLHYYYTH